ncbi:MAG TPA: hypothetical protein VIM65_00120 [Cyclobacteriaceae bacterium]
MTLAHSFAGTTIANSTSLTVSSKITKSETDLLKPLPIKNEAVVIKAAQWLNQSALISKLNYHISPAKENKQNNVVLKFQLADDLAANFILLKGLFEFGNASAFAISADRTTQTFELEIKSTDSEHVINVLETIFNWLVKEINFKSKLKEVIRWEQRIREEQNLAYSGLKSVFA